MGQAGQCSSWRWVSLVIGVAAGDESGSSRVTSAAAGDGSGRSQVSSVAAGDGSGWS